MWFRNWFGAEYLELYKHRTPEAAQAEIRQLFTLLPPSPFGDRYHSALDIACGAGRHTIEIAQFVPEVIGADLSEALLDEARAAGCKQLVRADMRALPFREEQFEIIFSLFNSFGYFSTDEEHLLLLRHWSALLKPGGVFVLDFFNRTRVIERLVPHSTEHREIRDDTNSPKNIRYEVHRRLSPDGSRIEKEIQRYGEGEVEEYLESVRLFTPTELTAIVTDAGFIVEGEYGSYGGEPFDESRSPQLLLIARRPA